jgi:hypothetical protein
MLLSVLQKPQHTNGCSGTEKGQADLTRKYIRTGSPFLAPARQAEKIEERRNITETENAEDT